MILPSSQSVWVSTCCLCVCAHTHTHMHMYTPTHTLIPLSPTGDTSTRYILDMWAWQKAKILHSKSDAEILCIIYQ